jgi:tetratricopeptide (TPR) repeat protein
LGTGLIDRFERTGSVADLKLAITHFRRAIDDAGPSDPDFPMYLSNLGTALSKLFGREPNTVHLNEAIEVLGRAVDMTKRSGARVANLPGYLNNLASALAIRHELSGARADLERSIEASSEVIAAIDPRAPMRPSFLANLGSRTNDPAHLDAAIESWEEALRVLHASYATAPVALKMGGQRTWPALYTNLASAYLGRMEADPHKLPTCSGRSKSQSKASPIFWPSNSAALRCRRPRAFQPTGADASIRYLPNSRAWIRRSSGPMASKQLRSFKAQCLAR